MKKIAVVLTLSFALGTSQAHASDFLTRLAVTTVVTAAAYALAGAANVVKNAVDGVTGAMGNDGDAIVPAKDQPDPVPQPTQTADEEKQ